MIGRLTRIIERYLDIAWFARVVGLALVPVGIVIVSMAAGNPDREAPEVPIMLAEVFRKVGALQHEQSLTV